MTDSGPTDLGTLLGHLSFHQILAVPRRVDATDVEGAASGARAPARRSQGSDAMRAGLLAALIGAHSEGSPVAVAWVRPAAPVPAAVSPIEVYVGGEPAFGDENASLGADPDAAVPILFPAGGRGRHVAPGHVIGRLTALDTWTRCGGIVDSHFVAPDDSPTGMYRAPFEEYIMSLPRQAFAWLVVAEPLGLSAVHTEMARLRKRMYDAKRSEKDAFEVERIEARHQELSRARATGLWRVHVLVGTPTARETRHVAALLCGGSDLARQPYILMPGTETCRFADIAACESTVVDGPSSPFDATTDLLATIGRPPEQEMPGVHLITLPTFDITPEASYERGGEGARASDRSICIGNTLDANRGPAGPMRVETRTLNRHTFVCGATGSGKSQTVRAMLEELAAAGIPWLVIEPAKAEYARIAGRLGSSDAVCVLRPGRADVPPAGLNPLEPEQGFPVQTHVDLVRSLFLAAFDAEDPLPQVLASALSRCYTDLGWDLALGVSRYGREAPRYPTLRDVQQTARSVVESIGYSQRVTDDVRGFIDVRLGSLRLGTPGRVFDGGHPLDMAALLKRNVVLEIEDVGDDQDKAFVMGIFLIRLIEHLRVNRQGQGGDVGLLHVTVVEEAHRLLKNAVPGTQAARAIELFAGLLAEIRAYGEGIVVVEQIPSKILLDVIKNTALKVMHRLPAQDDRDSVGATMNLDAAQSRYAVTLTPGQAAVFRDGMDRPVLMEVPYRGGAEQAAAKPPTIPIHRARSLACREDCQRGAYCTLEQITRASWLVDNPHDMRLTLWIDMLVVAHLIGMSRPVPSPAWLAELRTTPTHDLACAIGQCIQAAFDTRYAAIIPFYRPEDEYRPGKSLLTHVRDAAMAAVDGGERRCNIRSEVRFQAGRYRWSDIRHDLREAVKNGMPDRHPATDNRLRKRGLTLSGNSAGEQLKYLLARPESTLPGDAILYGVVRPSRIERAIERHGGHKPAWEERLMHATSFLMFPNNTDGDKIWPLRFMKQRRPIAGERKRS